MTRRTRRTETEAAEQWNAHLRTDAHDGTTIPGGWQGASELGLPHPGDQMDTTPLAAIRARRPAPAMFPALPGAPEPPRREPDEAMFTHVENLGLWVLLCGLCPQNGQPQSRHTDRAAQREIPMFNALRASARAAGWRTDVNGLWACPPCQDTAAYRAPERVTHHSANATQARGYGDVSGEFWHIVVAEQAAFERMRHARPGAVIIRPDGRFLAAHLIPGEPVKESRPGRHRAGAR